METKRLECRVPKEIKDKLQKLANRDTNGNITKKLIELIEKVK